MAYHAIGTTNSAFHIGTHTHTLRSDTRTSDRLQRARVHILTGWMALRRCPTGRNKAAVQATKTPTRTPAASRRQFSTHSVLSGSLGPCWIGRRNLHHPEMFAYVPPSSWLPYSRCLKCNQLLPRLGHQQTCVVLPTHAAHCCRMHAVSTLRRRR